ncbi:acetyl/propionyl/methylcrotonyl-CoA carboxylase subunit alpha [Sphingosinithalassobacter sp. LHW66-3]|uniref:acetyl/propionyl/methylcrotonyl-CoA carboxylase subunit alpha n=1 Tax=Sphingosinithalassobacter sp. LHW66-3 TaxID=3424718 RepID=UPI003D6C1986
MIQSLLIANRGEIACRIIRTARAMGIRTVAVYSDADAQALHVRQADEAVHIGPSPARESYLVGEKIIAAAKQTGAEAIHPGYGFLSENADFAQAVADAGLIWVGATPSSIRAMGLKDAAKKLMQDAGVPTTPGYLGQNQDPEHLKAEADKIGYPVLIKAVAGGGGKGMRRVDASADFLDALASCKREAASSFGDDRVLIEKYILSPRHIEVQVFGDTHGNVVHLFERDCSLQRRHQKVIEEAPAPGMDPDTREAICAAAVRAAKAVDYVGAGTIEFIADASEGLRADRIWFMEMNTRLQVEHPVTEEITGVDLVEWQLRVASGEKLPKRQDELAINGWAAEARLYAEDPATGFLPSIGRLESLDFYGDSARIETGVSQGSEVSPFYDPMIAKIIVHAFQRDEALLRLAEHLETVHIWPIKTNKGFLVRLLRDPEVMEAALDTGLIERKFDALTRMPVLSDRTLSDASAWLFRQSTNFGRMATSLTGFRINAPRRSKQVLLVNGKPAEFDYDPTPSGSRFEHGFLESLEAGSQFVQVEGDIFEICWPRADGGAGGAASDGAILAPMPGKVIALDVAQGDSVTAGQKLLTLEAMKMEHSLTAPFDGTVTEVTVEASGQVTEGTLLVRVERGEDA